VTGAMEESCHDGRHTMKKKIIKKDTAKKRKTAIAKRKKEWKDKKNNGPIDRGMINR
jgi:hypothetical protein